LIQPFNHAIKCDEVALQELKPKNSLRMHVAHEERPLSDTRKFDIYACLIIFLLPLLVSLPSLLDWWSADPIRIASGLTSVHGKQMLPGRPWIDPSVGFYSQALGKLAADEWLSGRIPWWNYYSGVGLPLAAEMSPGALFLPLVLLNHFPNGILYIKVILQLLAGLGTYFLLRKIGLTRLSATTGAVLYEFNGVFAWHAAPIVNPVPFLPWLILGVEYAREKPVGGASRSWLIIAFSLAFSIYSGFPETAYINGLLAGVWSLWRIFSASSEIRHRLITNLTAGTIVGLLLSIPAIIPFLEYCGRSYLGIHTASAELVTLRPEALPQVFFPWLYGNIFSYSDDANVASNVWGSIGGFLSAAQLTIIALGLFTTRRSSLYVVLLLWILICLARTFGLAMVSPLVNVVPGLKQVAFYRYSAPSWEFCSAVLCAIVVNDVRSGRLHPNKALIAGPLCALFIGAISLYPAYKLVRDLYTNAGYPVFFWASLAWGFGSIATVALLLKIFTDRHLVAGRAVAALLVMDAIVLFSVPSLSGLSDSQLATAGVNYLKHRIGFDRFYTLGPIAPNYGAYYRIASINHNYLPVAQDWVDYIKEHLDPYIYPVCFTGSYPRTDPSAPSQGAVLRQNLSNYAEIGVRYVVTPHEENPFRAITIRPGDQYDQMPQPVFESSVMDIYELSGTKPYFDIAQGNCSLHAESRSVVSVNCVSDAQLIRRELYYPGWTASVGGQNIEIKPYNQIFQAVKIPPGKYRITFSYSPTHLRVILGLFLTGVFLVVLGIISAWTPLVRRTARECS
jgi:hypothetical protein